MAINYPGGVDGFNVPTDPEDTPLSEAGSSTRNHVEWHADAGTAIVALEQNAAQLNHDHSGSVGVSITVTQQSVGTLAINDLQTITLIGTPTAGTFTLTFQSETTVSIAYNATAATVQTALQSLGVIGVGNVSVAGSAGGPWVVTFIGNLADVAQPTLTAQSALTGGSINVTHTTVGASGAASVQNIFLSATPSSGTFLLTFGGDSTPPLPFDAAAVTVQNALQALSSIGSGNVSVAGDGPYVVTFEGTLADNPQPLITAISSLSSGLFATNKLNQVNTHQNPDTDTVTTAIHHTIGTSGTQAAAGNHIHDYNGPTIINKPYILCTSTTRPSAPEVGEIIWETDTNRVRAWASFPNNVLETGTSFTDTFNRVSGIASHSQTGTGSSLSGGNNASATIILGAQDTCVLIGVTNYSSAAPWHNGWTTTATVGGEVMTQLGVMDNLGSLNGFLTVLGVIIPAGVLTGEQTIEVEATNGSNTAYLVIDSVSYANVGAFGPVVTNASVLGFSFPAIVPSSPGDVAVGFFCTAGQGVMSAPTGGTQRVETTLSSPFCSLLIQDAPGQLTTTLGVSSTGLENCSIGVNLIVASSTLGSNYNQAYVTGSSPSCGSLGVPQSGLASWIVGENVSARCIATCVASGATSTVTGDQDITFTQVSAMPTTYNGLSPTIDIYLRKSSDGQTYVRMYLDDGGGHLTYTTTGPTGEQPLFSAFAGTTSTNIPWEVKCTGNTFILYRGGVQVLSYVDTANVTRSGSAYQDWSWGMSAVPGATSQLSPPTVTDLSVNDLPIYGTQPIWQLLNLGAVPYVRAETHVGQEIAVNNMVSAFFDTILEDLFGFFGLGTIGVQTTMSPNTEIIINEAGHYDVHASIPWDPAYDGFDHAMLGFTVNGQDIGRKNWEFMRGNGFAPGFAQTNEMFMHWHFAAGDILRVVCAHNADFQQWLFYDPTAPNVQMAYVDLKFTGP